MTTRPLDGVRVLDFTRVLSGPHATRMLCDLGADVIKVEPPDGDITRTVNPRVNGLATYFVQQNVGKRNISLDTTKPEAVELLLRLADQCDVLIENFRPGVLDRIGLGYEVVAARNPRHRLRLDQRLRLDRAVGRAARLRPGGRCRDGHHQGAGRSRAAGSTPTIRSATPTCTPRSRPRRQSSPRCSTARGPGAAIASRSRWRRRCCTSTSTPTTSCGTATSRRSGSAASNRPRYPVLAAANGETVIISGHPAERGTFERYMSAIDRPDLIDDPRFADVPSRKAHFAELLGADRRRGPRRSRRRR